MTAVKTATAIVAVSVHREVSKDTAMELITLTSVSCLGYPRAIITEARDTDLFADVYGPRSNIYAVEVSLMWEDEDELEDLDPYLVLECAHGEDMMGATPFRVDVTTVLDYSDGADEQKPNLNRLKMTIRPPYLQKYCRNRD